MNPKFVNTVVPIGEEHFVFAIVWDDRADFENATTSVDDACFMDYYVENKDGTQITCFPCIGSVHFIRGILDAGLIAHEFTHAAFHLAKMLGHNEEEFIAEAVQEMNSNFWDSVQDNQTLFSWIYEDEI